MGMGIHNSYIKGLKLDANNYDKSQTERMTNQFETDASVTNGVVRWNSNGSIPPSDILEFWNHIGKNFDYQKSTQISDEESAEFFKQYRKAQENYVPSEEEIYEMRAAFGPGQTVVNIITGKQIIT